MSVFVPIPPSFLWSSRDHCHSDTIHFRNALFDPSAMNQFQSINRNRNSRKVQRNRCGKLFWEGESGSQREAESTLKRKRRGVNDQTLSIFGWKGRDIRQIERVREQIRELEILSVSDRSVPSRTVIRKDKWGWEGHISNLNAFLVVSVCEGAWGWGELEKERHLERVSDQALLIRRILSSDRSSKRQCEEWRGLEKERHQGLLILRNLQIEWERECKREDRARVQLLSTNNWQAF